LTLYDKNSSTAEFEKAFEFYSKDATFEDPCIKVKGIDSIASQFRYYFLK